MAYPNSNDRMTPDGKLENRFRREVREALGLAWDARDDTILAALRKVVEAAEIKADK